MMGLARVVALTVALLLHAHAPTPIVGKVFYYEPGVFAQVAANRGMPLRQDLTCYASTPDPRRLGQVAHVRIHDGPIEHCQILDYSNPRDLPRQRARGLVFEVNWDTAQKYKYLRADGKDYVEILGFTAR